MTPNDPLFPLQWYLKNTGQVVGSIPGIDINVEKVWDDYNGTGVTVGVYDDGVETAHPDLVANYNPALQPTIVFNGVPVTLNGQPVDNTPGFTGDNHGTAVAGIIAASTNNGLGVAGIAFGAKFGTVKILKAPVSGPTFDQLLDTLANFDVTNHSWGTGSSFEAQTYDVPFEDAAEDGRGGLGTIILKAAGNERLNVNNEVFRDANDQVPNISRHAVAVGAILNTGFVTAYSTPGANLLVSAPAGPSLLGFDQVITTDRVGELGYNPASDPIPPGQLDYTAFNGTSAAAPVVSGVVALMLQANPFLGWRDVQTILAYSARHVGSQIGDPAPPVSNELNTWNYNHAVDWNGGGLHFSRDYGFGLVDAFAAVRLAETWNVGSPEVQSSGNEESAKAVPVPGSTITDGVTTFVTFNISDLIRLEDVYLTLGLGFSDVSKLEITLQSPGDTVSEIWKGGGSEAIALPESWTFASREFFGESATGTWTLTITNNGATPSGTLTPTLTAYGAADTGHTYVYTDEFDDFGVVLDQRDTLAGSSGIDTLNAAAVTGDSVIDLVIGSSDTLIAGETVMMVDIGNGDIENAIGGDGNDTLIGNTVANKLFGERGNDTIDGGAGYDTIRGGAGNDTIDGGADGGKSVYSGSHLDYQLTQNPGGSLLWGVADLRPGAPDGTDDLSNVQFLQFTDTNIDLRAARNFDGLNRSDFAWQGKDGTPAIWLMDGTNVTFDGAVGPFASGALAGWQIKSTGDFNADGRSDFLWQGQDGTPAIWLMDGTNVKFVGAVGANPGPSWQIKSTGDFNDDVKSDILWQGQDGTPAIWLMDGTNVTFAGAVGPFASGALAGWQIKSTGDFNGDTKADILWQGQDGTPAIWLMDGTNVTFAGAVGPFASGALAGWQIKGSGDFNGDGKSDIVWQGQDGNPAIWLMDGTTVTGVGAVGFNPGASWHVVGTGQFNNGDINADILWQDDFGQAGVWLMDGMDVLANIGVGVNPGADWHLIA